MDGKIKLVIPRVPESYNVIKNWHWTGKDEYNRAWYWEVKSVWLFYLGEHRAPPLPFKKAKLDFYIYFPFKHRRDKLNYALGLKPVLDQIAAEGIIVDDNWERIEDQYYSRIDKINPRTEIMIEDLNEDF